MAQSVQLLEWESFGARALRRPSWRRWLNKHWTAPDSCEISPEMTLGLASTARRGFPGMRDP